MRKGTFFDSLAAFRFSFEISRELQALSSLYIMSFFLSRADSLGLLRRKNRGNIIAALSFLLTIVRFPLDYFRSNQFFGGLLVFGKYQPMATALKRNAEIGRLLRHMGGTFCTHALCWRRCATIRLRLVRGSLKSVKTFTCVGTV